MGFLATLPFEPTRKREETIISAVSSGYFQEIRWHAIFSAIGENSAIFYVASDALQLGDGDDRIRVNTTHTSAQRIADILGLALPTTKLCDLIHQQATVLIEPCYMPADEFMAYTNRMVVHSKQIDARIAGRQGLISTVGKDWILTNKLLGRQDRAANYGWHVAQGQFKGPGNLPVLQPLSIFHNRYYVDYSQTLRFVNRWATVNGQNMLLEDLLQDPKLATLASDEGPLSVSRHPGVLRYANTEPLRPW